MRKLLRTLLFGREAVVNEEILQELREVRHNQELLVQHVAAVVQTQANKKPALRTTQSR